ncbi:MAG: tetratricopeptide repeat protein [Planctomycetales bacterium]|nr:tetratricopeptide repeat protein [Planctomycetales bacterium]
MKSTRTSQASPAELARQHLDQGRKQEALEWATTVADAPVDSVEDRQNLATAAQILAAEGQTERALELYQRIHGQYPDDVVASFAIACCHARLGNADLAIATFRKHVLRPAVGACEGFAHALVDGGGIENAVQFLREMDANIRSEARISVMLASLLSKQGDDAGAISLLEECLKKDIGDNRLRSRAYFNLGVVSETTNPQGAEAAYRTAIEADSDYENSWINLAVLLCHTNRTEEAAELLDAARDRFPDNTQLMYLRGFTHRLAGDSAAAIEQFRLLTSLTVDHLQGWEMLGRCLTDSGQEDEAIAHYQKWLEIHPGHPVATHLLSALESNQVASRAAPEYVATTFDAFASTFEDMLVKLEYRGPEYFNSLLREHLGDPEQYQGNILDAGCGTGLMGKILRPFANRLTGVDLSSAMLAQAAKLKLYDELLQADLVDYLAEHAGTFDVVLAADTLNYFGDLTSVLRLCFESLQDGGWLFFSIEQGPLSDDCFTLMPHGRYVHSPHYLVYHLGELGVPGGTMRKVVLRKENQQDVNALLIAAQKTSP